MIDRQRRAAFGRTLKHMVGELFKWNGRLDEVDFSGFDAFFAGDEFQRTINKVARLVAEHSSERYIIEPTDRSVFSQEARYLPIFLKLVRVKEHDGLVMRPPHECFAFGPRKGVVVA